MALERYNIANNPIDASADKKILIAIDAAFYGIQINYSGFVPNANTGFKLSRTYSDNPQENNLVEIADASFVITDASGVVIFKNAVAEAGSFLVLEYTSDSNHADAEYSIITNFRN